jgi:ornithine decarboxylase
MDYFRRFTFLFVAPVFDADDLEGVRFNQIIAEIERSGFEVVRARKFEDAEIAVQTDAAIGCMVVDWGKKGLEGKSAALINLMRRRGLDLPIILLIRRKRFEDLPVEVLDFIDGYVGGDATLHRKEPDQPAEAVCGEPKNAVLWRSRRLCRGRQPALDLSGA